MYNPTNLNLPFLTRDMLAFGEQASFSLELLVIADTDITVTLKGFTKEGPFFHSHELLKNENVQSVIFGMVDVPISVSVSADFTATPAAVAHVTLHLLINSNRVVMLAQGVVGGVFGISWPDTMHQSPEQTNGPLLQFSFPDPAAGAEVDVATGVNEVWDVFAIILRYAADATVADRTVKLLIGDGVGDWFVRPAAATIQASEQQRLVFLVGGTTGATVANTLQEIALPPKFTLSPGSTIKTLTTNIQATDQIDLVSVICRASYLSQ